MFIQAMIRFAWKLDSEASEPWKSLTRAEASLNVFLLGCLILEPILIIVLESFTAHYDMLRLSYCTLDLVVLGFAQTDFMYHGLLIVASIYQLFLYLNVLRQRNICHLLALILFGFFFVIMSIVHILQHFLFEKAGCFESYDRPDPNSANIVSHLQNLAIIQASSPIKHSSAAYIARMKPFQYAILALTPLVFCFMFVVTTQLYKRFHWKNYHGHHFDSEQFQPLLIAWGLLCGLLKVDFFFLFAYAVQLVPSGILGYDGIWKFECVVVLSGSILVFLVLVFYGIRKENTYIIIAFLGLNVAVMGYFGYRTYIFAMPRSLLTIDHYEMTRYSLLFTTLVLLILGVLTISTLIICIRHRLRYKLSLIRDLSCSCPTCYLGSPEVNNVDKQKSGTE
ncbi:hypothetical protein CU097_007597 [Rhizopus azygosporus]|uniref:Uncharacterized protein n=2 Tax=Rhizopus TaxID=4842 RepID=A0A367JUJ1_RHIAZ|nr:hypothetical protein CU097_007597 [Rhizopus azygosporus]